MPRIGPLPAALRLARCAAPSRSARVPAAAGTGAARRAGEVCIAVARRARRSSLTSDSGWLTLAGLFWLKEGENSFGRGAGQ